MTIGIDIATIEVAHGRLGLRPVRPVCAVLGVNGPPRRARLRPAARFWARLGVNGLGKASGNKKANRKFDGWPGFIGALDRIRTCDFLLRRQTLYPLSYEGMTEDDYTLESFER